MNETCGETRHLTWRFETGANPWGRSTKRARGHFKGTSGFPVKPESRTLFRDRDLIQHGIAAFNEVYFPTFGRRMPPGEFLPVSAARSELSFQIVNSVIS